MASRTFQRSSALQARLRPQPRASQPGALRASTTRHASTAAAAPSNKLRNLVYGSVLSVVTLGSYLYFTDTRASLHQYVAPPVIRALYPDAEDAHHIGTKILKELWSLGLYPRERGTGDSDGLLEVEVFGHQLSNPVGISGGLDKNAEIPDPLFALGPAVVEVGGITPEPQEGNPQPRVFRIPSQSAIINRYGLNSEGADAVAIRLRQRIREYAYTHGYGIDASAEQFVLDGGAGVPPGSLNEGRILAVQIAKNKATPDSDLDAVVRDHVVCVEKLGKYADIIVVNVSSPNTPGLRALQSQGPLTEILSSVVEAANAVSRKTKPAVMVKVSPDENSDSQIEGICDAVWEAGVHGVIVGNTTKSRPAALPKGYALSAEESNTMLESGGYSGPQLFAGTLDLVKRYRTKLDEGPRYVPEPSKVKEDQAPTPKKTQQTDASGPISSDEETSLLQQIAASEQRDAPNLKPLSDSASSEQSLPIFRLPERHKASTSDTRSRASALSAAPKVIFASGGITTGEQALQVLDAGASVAMVYTAMTYGGVGTVGRIKEEMREEVRTKAPQALLLAR